MQDDRQGGRKKVRMRVRKSKAGVLWSQTAQVGGGGWRRRRDEGSRREGKVGGGRSDWRLCGCWRQTGRCVQYIIREGEGGIVVPLKRGNA